MAKFVYGDLCINFDHRTIVCRGQKKNLDAKAFSTLEYIHKHSNRVVSTDELLDHIWHGRPVNNDVLVAAIGRIRKVINAGHQNNLIRTIHKVGYQFDQSTASSFSHVHGEPVTSAGATGQVRKWMFSKYKLTLVSGFFLALVAGLVLSSSRQLDTVLILPPMFGDYLRVNKQSYGLQNQIIESIDLSGHIKAIDTTSVFDQMANTGEPSVTTNVGSQVFELSGADVLLASRLQQLNDGTSVVVKLIKPGYFECSHYFFIDNKNSISKTIAEHVSSNSSDHCQWSPLPNQRVEKKLVRLMALHNKHVQVH